MFSKGLKAARRGFTLIEIMIVVLIIGILLAIAVPNFVKARENSRAKSCVSNLKQIDSAKEQFAMDTRLTTGAAVATTNLYGSTAYIRSEPKCPSGGTYAVGNVGVTPTCGITNNGTTGDTTDDHILP